MGFDFEWTTLNGSKRLSTAPNQFGCLFWVSVVWLLCVHTTRVLCTQTLLRTKSFSNRFVTDGPKCLIYRKWHIDSSKWYGNFFTSNSFNEIEYTVPCTACNARPHYINYIVSLVPMIVYLMLWPILMRTVNDVRIITSTDAILCKLNGNHKPHCPSVRTKSQTHSKRHTAHAQKAKLEIVRCRYRRKSVHWPHPINRVKTHSHAHTHSQTETKKY